MKITVPLALILIIALFSNLGYAEFYKYKDANGVSHFTDDLNEVPEDQRPNVGRYKEADDALTPEQRHKKKQQEDAARRRAEKRSGKVKSQKKRATYSSRQRAELNKKKAALEQEKATLVKEQQALLKFNIKLADEIELKSHKRKVNKLNKRIQAYERKRQQFEMELARYQ